MTKQLLATGSELRCHKVPRPKNKICLVTWPSGHDDLVRYVCHTDCRQGGSRPGVRGWFMYLWPSPKYSGRADETVNGCFSIRLTLSGSVSQIRYCIEDRIRRANRLARPDSLAAGAEAAAQEEEALTDRASASSTSMTSPSLPAVTGPGRGPFPAQKVRQPSVSPGTSILCSHSVMPFAVQPQIQVSRCCRSWDFRVPCRVQLSPQPFGRTVVRCSLLQPLT